MAHILEPLITDILWEWVDQSPKYDIVTSEVELGDAGRIDLVTKTKSGRYVGFEVKAEIFKNEEGGGIHDFLTQLRSYRDSGFLDELYFVNTRVDPYFELPKSRTNRIKRELYMGFGTGLYEPRFEGMPTHNSNSDYIDVSQRKFAAWKKKIEQKHTELENRLPDQLLADFDMKFFFDKVYKHSKESPKHIQENWGFKPINIDELVEQLKSNWIKRPTDIGAIEIPISVDPGKPPNYSQKLRTDPYKLFDENPTIEVDIVKESDTFARSQTPDLSNYNEPWVQHYIWVDRGTVREAVIPDKTDNTERRIDVMEIKGGIHPTEVFQADSNVEIVGVEAKNQHIEPRSEQITEQLETYLNSKVLNRLFLAVPEVAKENAIDFLENRQKFDPIGLLAVDKYGHVNEIKDAEKRDVEFDSYRTDNGYLRSVGYGRLSIEGLERFESTVDLGINE
ncbi:MAG: hypothetical protein ABEI86_05285 [Halobacteriaceae archaeon]